MATTSADTTVRVWDATTGEELIVFTGHTEFVFDVNWSPNGKRLVSGDAAGMVRVWEAANGQEVDVYRAPGGVLTANWSSDGTRVVIGGIQRASYPSCLAVHRGTHRLRQGVLRLARSDARGTRAVWSTDTESSSLRARYAVARQCMTLGSGECGIDPSPIYGYVI